MNKEFLRYKLKEKGITTQDVAKRLGITRQGLNKRILNDRLFIEDAFIIMEMLGLSFDDIFKRSEAMKK